MVGNWAIEERFLATFGVTKIEKPGGEEAC